MESDTYDYLIDFVLLGAESEAENQNLWMRSLVIFRKKKNANIVRIKLNLKKNESFLDGDKLYAYIEQQYDAEKNNYLFNDEVQMCVGFERV
ncbi:MAG: hypothetical protein K6F97_04650 [Lachnospiraceae bacterium]|nr:hypothetical protein [Lachnospiraceae bacterium]